MKYSELHKKLRRAGCYPTGKQLAGHAEWYSPITNRYFATTNHESHEVSFVVLKHILQVSGVKLK